MNDLNEYPHVILTSPNNWNPSEIKFPGIGDSEICQIEGRGIGSVGTIDIHGNFNYDNYLGHDNPYLQPMKIFDLRAFNARIIGSVKVPVDYYEGPFSESTLKEPKTFISSN